MVGLPVRLGLLLLGSALALMACGGDGGSKLVLRQSALPDVLPTEEELGPYGSFFTQADAPTRPEDAATLLSISDEVDAEVFRLLEARGFVAGWARAFRDDLTQDALLAQVILFATGQGAREFLDDATKADLAQLDVERKEVKLGDRSQGFCVAVRDLCEVRFVLGNAVVVMSLLTGGELNERFQVVRELGALSEGRLRRVAQ